MANARITQAYQVRIRGPAMVRLVVLNDNEPGPGLLNEWGWSLYIDGPSTILFDADTDYRVIEYNASQLGVDLSRLDYAVLSHWHRDHYGGFPAVARMKPKLRVYAPPGPSFRLERLGLQVVTVKSALILEGGVVILPPLYAENVDLYEIALSIPSRRGRILVVGCSHPGVDKLAEQHLQVIGEEPYMVIGGFHSPPRRVLDRLAGLVRGPICAAHCSGDEAKEYIAREYREKACNVRTGSVIEV